MKKIDWLIIILIIVVSAIALWDLFKPGMYTSHDGIHQVVRFYYFDQALRDGQIPPRWVGGLMNGFGYPLFIFSYHLPWFIAEIIHVFGSSIIDSVKMTFLVGFILSGITMYLFQKELFGRVSGIVGTLLYLIAPYRFSNIFVRAAIGDATSFIFPPLLFLSVFKLKTEKKLSPKWIFLGAIAFAGLLLSHAMVFLLFSLTFVVYFIYSFLLTKEKLKFTKYIFIMIVLGLGLSSYYLIPSVMEKSFGAFDQVMGQVFLGNVFLNLKELLYSSWGYGMMHAKEGGMSFQVGIAQWLSAILTVLIITYLFVAKKVNKKNIIVVREAFIYLVLFVLSIILMLPISVSFWKLLSNVMVIDFPWRILAVSVFSGSILSGFIVNQPKMRIFSFAFLILVAFYTNRNHLRINQTLDWDLPFMIKLERTTNTFDEYKPKWVKEELISEKSPRIEFSEKDAKIDINKIRSNYQEFAIDSELGGKVRMNTIYYPGWKVWVDRKEEKIDYSNGLIEFKIGEGKKNVVARFTETPLRMVSNIISLVTLALLFLPLLPVFKGSNNK